MYGPKGILVCKFFVLLSKLGTFVINAIKEEKNKIKGRQIQPNQKPIAAKSFASPNPIPSIFFNFLYKKIINQIIVYPATPPMIEFR